MAHASLDRRIEAVRRFNRFYTRQIGVLREGLLDSPFSLTEARVIYELAHHEDTTATELSEELALDPGYMSRILRSFQQRGLIRKERSDVDGRRKLIRLTDAGESAFAKLNDASRREIRAMLEELSELEQQRLVHAIHTLEEILGAAPEDGVSYILRPHHAGDMGWVIHRHGVLYNREYGWNEEFEALVAKIVADFMESHDPKRERCWIAEREGENVGSVFLVQEASGRVARLRLLLVEPEARGLGIGSRLVHECTRFARRVGYEKIVLWTNDVLVAARRIYEEEGYRLVEEDPHHSFGQDLVGQTWELEL